MGFMSMMENNQREMLITENGAYGYKSTGNDLLDFFFKVSSFRNMDTAAIESEFQKVIREENILKFLYYIRDCRSGLGERRLFRVCMKKFITSIPEYNDNIKEGLCVLFDATLKYGRADDLFHIIDFSNEKLVNILGDYLLINIGKDVYAYNHDEPISIMYKWFPSENASSKNTKKLAKNVRKMLKMSSKDYRRMLTKFRSKLNITERYMCAKKWKEIDYNKVPSKANIIYSDAFLWHDLDRRNTYLNDLTEKKPGIKINSSCNYPYEIYHKYVKKVSSGIVDTALEELWKNLKLPSGLDNTLVICDGSASMTYPNLPKSDVVPLDISRSLAIYCSEHCSKEYKDKFITFSSNPEYVDLSICSNLKEKIVVTGRYIDISNTDLEKTFDLILNVAIKNNLKQKDLPRQLLIVSDMEFDEGTNFTHNPIESAQQKFNSYGYKLPRLIFWNVASRTKTIPVKQNDLGVICVSGFSQNIISMVNNGELDPLKALLKELDKYKDVPKLTYLS